MVPWKTPYPGHRRRERMKPVQLDLEIGRTISVHIAGDEGIGGVLKEAQLARMVGERAGAEKVEGLISSLRFVGVDLRRPILSLPLPKSVMMSQLLGVLPVSAMALKRNVSSPLLPLMVSRPEPPVS